MQQTFTATCDVAIIWTTEAGMDGVEVLREALVPPNEGALFDIP